MILLKDFYCKKNKSLQWPNKCNRAKEKSKSKQAKLILETQVAI